MKHTAVFRFTAITIIWLYSAALAQAGQVITQTERDWAEKAVQQEKTLGAVSAPNSIAVLYFNNKSGQTKLTPLQKGMAVMLITDLSKVEQLRVVERVRMQALLDELELGASGLMDAETAPRIGKLLGAAKVTSGDILKGGAQDLAINSSVLDVPFDKIAEQPSAAGALDELFRLEKEILFNIIEYMQISVSPQKKAELERPLSASTPALLALFLGIDYSDRGLYNLAAKMYKQALAEDPYLGMAKSALQELKGMGLIRSKEVQAPEETEPAEPAADSGGGISTGTVVGIGIGLAAVGAGAVYLMNDDDETDDPPVDDSPNVTRIEGGATEIPDCGCEGNITFSFSAQMEESKLADISPQTITSMANQFWDNGEYKVTWRQFGKCEDYTVSVDLSGFHDIEGNALTGETLFNFTCTFERYR